MSEESCRMSKYKTKLNSFQELDSFKRKEDFEHFLKANESRRKSILRLYGLEYGDFYNGYYHRDSNCVELSGVNNPFTGEKLIAKVLNSNFHNRDGMKVTVLLQATKAEKNSDPNTIFTCIVKKEEKDELYGGVPVYLKKEADNEKRKEIENRRKERAEKRRREKEVRDNRIKTILHNRKIKQLIHFTRLENLSSIIINGIMPVTELNKKGIRYTRNDFDRLDRKIDCVCTSIEYPNVKVLRSYVEKNRSASWAILLIDASVIIDYKCYFARHNAATSEIAYNLNNRSAPNWFEGLFEKSFSVKKADGEEFFDRSEWRKEYAAFPTSDQAEVLIEGIIDKKYINSICFMNNNDMERYTGICREYSISVFKEKEAFEWNRNYYYGLK